MATYTQSCKNCPSFLTGDRQKELLGSEINAPICAIKMLPLVMPQQSAETQDKVFRHVASKCNKYNEDVVLTPLGKDAAPNFSVGIDTQPASPTVKSEYANCAQCANYIHPTTVLRETGWLGGICRATGNLMPVSHLRNYSLQCGSFVRLGDGPDRSNTLGTFQLFLQFSPTFGTVNYAEQYRNYIKNLVDPREWPNERPLNDKLEEMMRRRGIRAWRKIEDPDGYGEPVWLPIYDESRFPEEERALIPRTGDYEHPELYADHGQLLYTMAVLWMKLDETPAWWGQGGTGKTEFARHLAWLMCLPFHRINITAQTDVDDLLGKMLFEKGETRFHYGRLPSAWMRPGVILLDEPNTGPPEVWQAIRPLTDNSRMLVLDQNKNERIKRHIDCYFTMAMNPAWDVRNVGAQTIGDADNSRLMHIYFGYPPEDLEKEIIQRRVALDGWEVPQDQLSALMKVCKELRQASEDGVLHTSWGVRHQIKVARALRWFPPIKAYRRAVGDALEPEQLEAVLTIVKSHFIE